MNNFDPENPIEHHWGDKTETIPMIFSLWKRQSEFVKTGLIVIVALPIIYLIGLLLILIIGPWAQC